MERKILAAVLTDRNNWNKIQGHLKQEELSAEGSIIYDLIQEYYALDNGASSVDCDLLEPRIARRVSSNKHVEVITNYLKQCAGEDTSGVNVVQEVLDHKAHAIGLKLAAKLASGKQSDDVNQLMEDWRGIKAATSLGQFEVSDEEFSSVKPSTLLKTHFAKEGLIEVWPKPLNDMIDGGAKPGHHILVFAPTEMGKTLMVINMVAGFLKNGHKVLYIGNEDPAPDILMRVMSRMTGMTKYEIEENPDHAQMVLDDRNWKNFVLAALAPGTFGQIQRLVEKHNPKIVVLDQLRNLNVESENRTQALEKAATSARNLAKRNDVLVVSVTQAADSASRKTVLDRGDVDGSNVGIPGQCDLMIGIGADDNMERQGLRVLSFPKNKLSGRHTPIPVTFNYALSKIEA
jgi:archaellum biogenesis ATPase FlaH